MFKTCKPWTEKEVKQLIKLNKRKKTIAQISDKMGRSKDSIKGKLKRLNLKINKTIRVYPSRKNPLGNIYYPKG